MPDPSFPAAAAPGISGWRLEHSYAGLLGRLHARVDPTPVPAPRLVVFNRPLARALGLDPTAADTAGAPVLAAQLAGNELPPGARPLAQAYAGHQYGRFVILGDGRAILLGEQRSPDGGRWDIQLKGPGRTPYSRSGDGRAALGPMLREYLISEAMHALGIPTTRSLAVVATGEVVYRDEPLPGAVLTRVAASHLRIGTFEWAAAHEDREALQALADHAAERHYPDLPGGPERPVALLEAIVERQARLVARWQGVGFVHGVMNTDNMACSGETIDYGPCAFMEAYDPATVFSSIDRHGRYAYGNQPGIAQWNLARLAEAMLPLLHPDQTRAVELANAVIDSFRGRFERHWLAGMRAKLGLFSEEPDDPGLIAALLDWMHRQHADFTNTFRGLSTGAAPEAGMPADPDFDAWHRRWLARLSRQPQTPDEARTAMRRNNPAFIPRNHRVEEALEAATRRGDLKPLERLLEVLATPFEDDQGGAEYRSPAPPGAGPYRTFCGT